MAVVIKVRAAKSNVVCYIKISMQKKKQQGMTLLLDRLN